MGEQWKVIEGHEQYLISDEGRVFSKKTNRLLKPSANSSGYLRIPIDSKYLFVHRLVAIAFVDGRTDQFNTVNHKDFNPLNNSASNLEWTTPIGNYMYSFDRGRYVRTKAWRDKLKDSQTARCGKPVKALMPDGSTKMYISTMATSSDGHIPSMVRQCCNGKRKTHHGLSWEYVCVNK